MFSTTATPRPSDVLSLVLRWLSRMLPHRTPAAIEQAHTQRRLYDHHPDTAFHDAGLSRDDALAVGSHQPALPFFLQSGFGKR